MLCYVVLTAWIVFVCFCILFLYCFFFLSGSVVLSLDSRGVGCVNRASGSLWVLFRADGSGAIYTQQGNVDRCVGDMVFCV